MCFFIHIFVFYINKIYKKMDTEKKITQVVSTKQAVKEAREFIYFHDDLKVGKLKNDDDVITDSPYIVSAIERGLLVINENKVPVYELTKPIGEGDHIVSKIEFKTRIKPMENAAITKGLDISKNQFEYILRCNCYLTGQAKGVFDNFEKYDLKVIEQICSLFL